MYASTLTMEEEQMQFRPVTLVIETLQLMSTEERSARPNPVINSPLCLPHPMPTFTINAPPNQGPRAFF